MCLDILYHLPYITYLKDILTAVHVFKKFVTCDNLGIRHLYIYKVLQYVYESNILQVRFSTENCEP